MKDRGLLTVARDKATLDLYLDGHEDVQAQLQTEGEIGFKQVSYNQGTSKHPGPGSIRGAGGTATQKDAQTVPVGGFVVGMHHRGGICLLLLGVPGQERVRGGQAQTLCPWGHQRAARVLSGKAGGVPYCLGPEAP